MKSSTLFLIVFAIILAVVAIPAMTDYARNMIMGEAFSAIEVAKTVSTYNEDPLPREEVLANIRGLLKSVHEHTPIQCAELVDMRTQAIYTALPAEYKDEYTQEQYRQNLEKQAAKQCGLRKWLQNAEVLVDNYPQKSIPSTLLRPPTDEWLDNTPVVTCVTDAQALDATLFVPLTGYKLAVRWFLRSYADKGDEEGAAASAPEDVTDPTKCSLTTLPTIPYIQPKQETTKHETDVALEATARNAEGKKYPCNCVPMINPATGLVEHCANCPSAQIDNAEVLRADASATSLEGVGASGAAEAFASFA